MSRSLAQQFVEWEAVHIRPDYDRNHDDRRVCFYAMTHGIPVFVASRQIVQHLGAAHSSVGYSNAGRVASNLFTGDGAGIDWDAGLPSPPQFSGTIPKDKMRGALI